jgi:glyoxylase-like metal-dependent hydrolase (beta-lactamase superfamily II)
VAFLKSFERFTKQRLGQAPDYKFLVEKYQVASAGDKPWSRVSEHLYITGNTYVLVSKDNACLIMDPFGRRLVEQLAQLKKDHNLGPTEVVMFSHAHYDHYDGIHQLPERDQVKIWTLDLVAQPLAEPFRWRAPFLDPRPVRFDQRFAEGDTAQWREYRFRFHHLPGQSYYTMGVETVIDGKRCYFTADNFFHQDQFSGSGGWMGLNRSWPLPYAASAQKVLDAAPDWVLAEHGGPYEFNAEDYRRRVRWGEASARAADAVSVSGNHRRDWDPSLIRFEPLVQKVKPGAKVHGTLVAFNPQSRRERLSVRLRGRDLTADQTIELDVPAGGSAEQKLEFQLGDRLPAGRHLLTYDVRTGASPVGVDGLLVFDVSP